MTEERVYESDCKCEPECKCKTCKYICKFLFLTGAIFLGTFLALSLANALQRPKFPPFPCNCMRHRMGGFERQVPYHMDRPAPDRMHRDFDKNPANFDGAKRPHQPQRPEKEAR